MKKYLFIAAVAAMSLASCSKNVVLPNMSEQNAITVGVYADRATVTKGTETTIDVLEAENAGFYMNAVLYNPAVDEGGVPTEPNFMYEQPVYFTDTDTDGTADSWTYSPLKFWPTESTQRIYFYAWAPVNAVELTNAAATKDTKANELTFVLKTTTTSGEAPNLTTETDLTQMVDFVAASTPDMGIDAQTGAAPANVTFNFKHELSRLAFSARTNTDLSTGGSYVVVKKATILADNKVDATTKNEIYTSGKYTFSNTADTRDTWSYTEASVISADLDLSSIWSQEGKPLGEKPAAEGAAADAPKEYYYQNTEKCPIIVSNDTDKAVNLFADTQYLFLLPLASGTTEGKTVIEFEYDIVTLDSKLQLGYSVSNITKQIALPEGILTQGVAYNVCFVFGVNAIEIGTVSVEDWTNVAGTADEEEKVEVGDITNSGQQEEPEGE